MQVTLGAQTRDTITAVGKDTGSKKKNTLFIREENTVSFRGNSQRDAQQPAISSAGSSTSPEDPPPRLLQERQLYHTGNA